jgi:Domain of unknown function (DUF6438)
VGRGGSARSSILLPVMRKNAATKRTQEVPETKGPPFFTKFSHTRWSPQKRIYTNGRVRKFSIVVALASVTLSGAERPVLVDRWELAMHRMNWPAIRSPEATQLEMVTMDVEVDTQGRVTSVTALLPRVLRSPQPIRMSPFAERAIAEMRSRTYIPFQRNGKATPATFQDSVFFLPPERLPSVHRPFPEIHDWNTLRIRLNRGTCFGACLAYDLEIRGDGTVRYKGEAHVAVTGEHESSISRKDLETLLDLFRRADFFSLDSKYSRDDLSDGSTIKISLAFDGYDISVVDYFGAEGGMPESAERLIGAIDLYGGANKWIRGDENTVAALKRENFDFHSQKAGEVLVVAARLGDLKAVQDLVAAGAPLGIVMKTLFGDPGPPLRSAVQNNNIQVLEFLIKAGASKKDPTEKKAALELAVQIDRKEAIALLRKYIAAAE